MAILNVYIMSVFAIKKNESTPPPPPYSLVPICVSISLLLLLSFISNTLLNFHSEILSKRYRTTSVIANHRQPSVMIVWVRWTSVTRA